MNKTAVEWLEDTLNKRLIHLSDEKTHIKHFVRTAKCAEVRKILETINQAKKMEREQMLKAINLTIENEYIEQTWANCKSVSDQAEQYYNQIFTHE